jgi:hypothetical protein
VEQIFLIKYTNHYKSRNKKQKYIMEKKVKKLKKKNGKENRKNI